MDLFLSFVRALFPNWNFFDKIAFEFEVQYQIKDSSDWHPLCFPQKQNHFGFFFNPDLNLSLAQMNVIEHFAHDYQKLTDEESVETLTSFQLLKNLVNEYLRNSNATLIKVVAKSPNQVVELYTWKQNERP